MNASYRLNTCKSRGNGSGWLATRWTSTGGWVRNAYPTCRSPGDSPWKRGLTPDGAYVPHGAYAKCEGLRWGCVPLGSRRGNGPPGRRWLGVLRGRPPTLGLRHGPDSYGRQREEYWSMAATLNQPSSVRDDGPTGCKLLLRGDKKWDVSHVAGTARIRTG